MRAYQKHIVFMVRYSVLVSKARAGWRIARDAQSVEEYAKTLFNPSRLESKASTLEHVVLSSLRAQTPPPDTKLWLLLLVSDALPIEHRGRLERVISEFARTSEVETRICDIRSPLESAEVRSGACRNMNEAFSSLFQSASDLADGNAVVASVRLDDDDALAAGFSTVLAEHMEAEAVGLAVSFPCGFEAEFDNERFGFRDFKARYFPKIALGLSYIERLGAPRLRSVMSIGNHTTIDERVPVLLDSRYAMYVRGRAGVNDSGAPAFLSKLPRAPSLQAIKDAFPFLTICDEDTYVRDESSLNNFSWVKDASLSGVSARQLRAEIRQRDAAIDQLRRRLRELGAGDN